MTMTRRDNVCVTGGALGIGLTPARARTNAVINYLLGGRALSKASTDDLFILAGTSLAARQTCVFFLSLDAAGNPFVAQSAVREASTSTSTTARYVAGGFDWPQVPDRCQVGAVQVNSGAAAFVPGTTSLASVATYVNAGPHYGAPILF